MATQVISGLASGLDTSSIINQLMQLEAQPQTVLKTRMSTEQSELKALQSLNSKFLSLYNSAKDLTATSAWSACSATSSSDNVTATTTSTASPGSVSFTVNATARAHNLTFNNTAALTDVVTTGSTQVHLDFLDGNTLDVETGDGTLGGLVNAINSADAGVHASTVQLNDGTYRLSVTSTTTGAASDFTLTNLDGSAILGDATVTAGQDASITVGPDTITSATNSFTGVFSGVDVTLANTATAGENVTVTVAQDTSSLGDKIQSLVDSVNSLLDDIDKDTAYDSNTKTQGVLGGESSLDRLRSELVNSVFPGGTSSMADYGLQVDRYGKLSFDKDKFDTAYAADPAATTAAFTDGAGNGFTYRLEAAADLGSNADSGILTNAISSRNTGISGLQDQIDNWDVRLALKRSSLEKQFTALETAMSQMQSQSQWLAGQIAGLPAAGL